MNDDVQQISSCSSRCQPQPQSAASLFVQTLASQVNQPDVETVLQAQKLMLLRFEKTNEMLFNCNALSLARYVAAHQEFRRHTQHLVEMKKDLDAVFRRIRNIKVKLAVQYPQAFEVCSNVYNVLEEEEEEAEGDTNMAGAQSSSCSSPSPTTSPQTSSDDTG